MEKRNSVFGAKSPQTEREVNDVAIDCRCGRTLLQLTSESIVQFYCHCDDCRAVSGGAFSPIALFPSDSVSVVGGETFTWTYKTLPRTRCSVCGTLLFGEPKGSGMRGVSGFLLPVSRFRPMFHIRCSSAVLAVDDALPHFKDLPASMGGSDEKVGW